MSEAITPEIAYSCDVCGELFDSPEDAQRHNQESHAQPTQKDDLGASTESNKE